MGSILVNGPLTIGDWFVALDADWIEALPQIREGEDPKDLTGCELEMFIRPAYDSTVLIKFLSSATGEIVITDANEGEASMHVSRPTLIADIPVGKWHWFWLLKQPDMSGYLPWLITELMRGEFNAHPGRI